MVRFSLYKRRRAKGVCYYVRFWNPEKKSYDPGLSIENLRSKLGDDRFRRIGTRSVAASIAVRAYSAGVQMLRSSIFSSDRRSSSPDTIYIHSASIAQEMNLSSSGSLHMLISDEGIITLNTLKTSSMSCCFSLDGYFFVILSMTSLYSSHISGDIYMHHSVLK